MSPFTQEGRAAAEVSGRTGPSQEANNSSTAEKENRRAENQSSLEARQISKKHPIEAKKSSARGKGTRIGRRGKSDVTALNGSVSNRDRGENLPKMRSLSGSSAMMEDV